MQDLLTKVKNLHIDGDRAAAELCKRHLSFFVKEFWEIVASNDLEWSWHLDVMCDEIQRSDERVFKRLPKLHDLIFNVPPGTTKTKILSEMSTAWEFARMPEIKVFVGSFSDSAVSSIADNVRLIMKSEKYQKYFPNVDIRKDMDSLHNFKTTSNGEFYAFTVGGTITSKHADILKVDDPLNPKQAVSKTILLVVNSFFDKTLPTRKIDKTVTPTYLTMQRLHFNDPTGHLLSKKGKQIRLVCLPAELTDDTTPEYRPYYRPVMVSKDHPMAVRTEKTELFLLDPVRLGPDALAEAFIDLGGSEYSGQFLERPVKPGGIIWKKSFFIVIDDSVFPRRDIMNFVGTDWDLAYTADDENAASAYITAGKVNNKMFIDDLGWKYAEFPETIKYMKLRTAPHYIEAKASGKSAKQTLVKNGIPAIEVQIKGGADKIARANMSTPYAQAGLVCVRKSLLDRLLNDPHQGILNFPKNPKQDLADVLAQSIQRLFKGKIIVASSGQSILDRV